MDSRMPPFPRTSKARYAGEGTQLAGAIIRLQKVSDVRCVIDATCLMSEAVPLGPKQYLPDVENIRCAQAIVVICSRTAFA